jgi:hypothetical protein
MPSWLSELISIGVAAALTAVIVGFLRRRALARREAALREGKPTSFEAFLRSNVAPYPRRWRYGWVNVGLGPPLWKPRFSLRRQPVALPASARIEKVRRAAGFKEMLATNPDCSILHARAEHVELELAIMTMDVPSALRALESGSGGGWRLVDPLTPTLIDAD